ncbi:MAG: hypothetical protein A2X64_07260 [Ignavibacteria bacterium GWF2_33_9]|nr:MAG: hypothetical protein A2X64_07260 [Ignavibacteria bacterium GWF2_33_9]
MNTFSKYTEKELSFLMKSEDKKIAKQAFDTIYSKYSAKIYTYCVRFLRDKQLAQDVFQDTFIRFYDIVKSKEGIEKIGGYILKIARNLCINAKRDSNYNNLQLDESIIVNPNTDIDHNDNHQLLLMAINRLPDTFREIIILKEYLNYTYDEIAESMEINRNSVGVTLHRAKSKLKEILEPYINEISINEDEYYELRK